MSNCFYSLLMKYAPAATSMPSVVIRSGETRGVEVGGGGVAGAEGGRWIVDSQRQELFFPPFFPSTCQAHPPAQVIHYVASTAFHNKSIFSRL